MLIPLNRTKADPVKHLERAIEHTDNAYAVAPETSVGLFAEHARIRKSRKYLVDAISTWKYPEKKAEIHAVRALCSFYLTDTTHEDMPRMGSATTLALALGRQAVQQAIQCIDHEIQLREKKKNE